jgi:hypothetical protein
VTADHNYGTKEAPKRLEDDYQALSNPATGGKIVCGALVRKGLWTGEPLWEDKFPVAVRLESKEDPPDPQSPEIKIILEKFPRRCCASG